jgi:hypothetical protein
MNVMVSFKLQVGFSREKNSRCSADGRFGVRQNPSPVDIRPQSLTSFLYRVLSNVLIMNRLGASFLVVTFYVFPANHFSTIAPYTPCPSEVYDSANQISHDHFLCLSLNVLVAGGGCS